MIPLFEEVVFDVHLEAENLAKAYPPKGFNVVVPKTLKLKKDFKDLVQLATTKVWLKSLALRRGALFTRPFR